MVFVKRAIVLAAVSLAAVIPAIAQTPVSQAELMNNFVGRTAVFQDGAQASYARDGGYVYAGPRGRYTGRYTMGNGTICVDFTNGNRRCDTIVKHGNGYVLINSNRQSYPITLR